MRNNNINNNNNNNNNKCLDRLKLKVSRKHGKPVRPSPGPGLGPNCYRARSPCVVLSGFPSLGRTTTLFPFPDLNLTPDCATSSAAGVPGVTGRSLVQKLDVNAESIEDSQTQKPSESVSVHGVVSDSDHTPPPPPSSELSSSALALSEGYGGSVATGLNSLAIVAVPDDRINQSMVLQAPPGFENYSALTSVASPGPPQKSQRPQELARWPKLGHEHHRGILKRTRKIFEDLRISEMMKGLRGDTAAATKMKKRGLWLNQEQQIVGSIPGFEIGETFYYRQEMCVVGLHGKQEAGIDYIKAQQSPFDEPIATSIVVSDCYEDDEDTGKVLVYTGHGGQDKVHRRKQCRDQKLAGGNLAMERSFHHGVEIRVIRGVQCRNSISSRAYLYDGLYKITDWWFDTGKSGFKVYKFRLVRIEGQPEMGSVT